MHFETLWVQHLRCIDNVEIELNPQKNIFVGDNGAGKTSLLEAFFLLGRGQSFRSGNAKRLISDSHNECLVRAKVVNEHKQTSFVGLLKSAESTQIRIGEDKSSRLSDLARACPVLVLEPGQHRLIEDGPILRRRYLDWSVFHVEHSYHSHWQRFSRALKQRNSLLRSGQVESLKSWTHEFIEAAEKVHAARSKVFDELLEPIKQLIEDFLGNDHRIQISYRSGWLSDTSLQDQLTHQLSMDQERGFTQSGPHRAEIRITQNRLPVRENLSRGQQKLLITAMLLAQAQHFRGRLGINPVLLVDDLASELGELGRERLYQFLMSYSGQVIVTSLSSNQISEQFLTVAKMFHVKHGAVLAMV